MPATHRFPMTSIEWYRVYHGMPEDAKLKVIAKRSQQLMTHVVTIWLCVLDAASRHKTSARLKLWRNNGWFCRNRYRNAESSIAP